VDRDTAAPPAPNGAQPSRIFDPNKAQRRPAGQPTSQDVSTIESPPATPPIERDPTTGRFLKPGFPAHLVSKARRLGLTDDDFVDIEDPRELRDLVRERDFELRLSQVFDPARVAAAVKAQQTPLETPTARVPLDLGLNDEEDNPRLIEALTKLRDHYEGEIEGLRKELGDVKGRQQQRERAESDSHAKRIEREFAKYPEIFGTGPTNKLDPDSVELGFRLTANAYHRKTGEGAEGLAANIAHFIRTKFRHKSQRRRAVQEFEDEDNDNEVVEELDEAEQWERGVLARPTQAGAREAPPGREKAAQNLKRRLSGAVASDARRPRGLYLNPRSSRQG
jgi:hypothetical protein